MLGLIERARKNELLRKFHGTGMLSPFEAQELQDLVQRDTLTDEDTKALLLFAIGVLIALALSKK